MEVNILGLVVLMVFYLVIIVVGSVAARVKRRREEGSRMEEAIVAGRDINVIVGIFTMTGIVIITNVIWHECCYS